MRFSRCLVAALCMFTVFAWCPTSLQAQSDVGSITGFVHDPTGAVVPNASVTVKDEATGTERKVTTNNDGVYTVTNIPSAFYTVSVDAPGFKKSQTLHSKLDPNSTARVDVTLAIGQATETVEVTASSQQLQTDSAAVQKLVTRSQIDSIRAKWSQSAVPGSVDARRPARFLTREFQLRT